MSCPCTGTPPCWVCAPLTPDRRPYVPPVVPAERVQEPEPSEEGA